MIGSKYWIILVIHFWTIKLTNLNLPSQHLACFAYSVLWENYMIHKVLWYSCMCMMCPLVLCSAAMACLLTCRGMYSKIATTIKALEHLKSPHMWNLSTNSWYSWSKQAYDLLMHFAPVFGSYNEVHRVANIHRKCPSNLCDPITYKLKQIRWQKIVKIPSVCVVWLEE